MGKSHPVQPGESLGPWPSCTASITCFTLKSRANHYKPWSLTSKHRNIWYICSELMDCSWYTYCWAAAFNIWAACWLLEKMIRFWNEELNHNLLPSKSPCYENITKKIYLYLIIPEISVSLSLRLYVTPFILSASHLAIVLFRAQGRAASIYFC